MGKGSNKRRRASFQRNPHLYWRPGVYKNFGKHLSKFAEKITRTHPSGPDVGILDDLKSEIIRSAGENRERQDSEICTNN